MQRRNLKRGGFFLTPQCKFARKIIEQGRLWCTFSLHVTGKGLKLRTRYQSRGTSGGGWGSQNLKHFVIFVRRLPWRQSWKLEVEVQCYFDLSSEKIQMIFLDVRNHLEKWFLSGGFPEDRVGSWSAVLFWCWCSLPATSTHKPGPSLNNHLWASS